MGISDLVALQTSRSSRDLKEARERETPVVLKRLESVVQAITSSPALSTHATARIATMIFEEGVAEVRESGMGEEFISSYILLFGKIFEWCATGDDSEIPDDVRKFLGMDGVIKLGIE